MTTAQLIGDIARDEGCRLHAYPDPLSGAAPWTCGYGCTGAGIDARTVWTQAQADAALAARVHALQGELDQALPWWRRLDDARQDVLVNMAYNLGLAGLLGFRSMLAACEAGRFGEAGRDMLRSAWARQVHGRALRLAAQMERGEREAAAA